MYESARCGEFPRGGRPAYRRSGLGARMAGSPVMSPRQPWTPNEPLTSSLLRMCLVLRLRFTYARSPDYGLASCSHCAGRTWVRDAFVGVSYSAIGPSPIANRQRVIELDEDLTGPLNQHRERELAKRSKRTPATATATWPPGATTISRSTPRSQAMAPVRSGSLVRSSLRPS